MNAWAQRTFMNGKLLIEFEISYMGIGIKIVLKEVEALQNIGLFDVNAAQNSVPTPFLIDGSMRG
jgi:hypothetical protein